ncbi:coronin-6-like isoform X2 [Bolinopsis microptera]|uniref:coronin-6-like isoform X2 n=1 Tax=Bolinopsis microptera TaxID=2820187 RepID=UPI00307A7CB1
MAVRTSKFRHIYGDRNVKSYNGVPISKNAHEQGFCSVNPKFVAVVAEQIGGGAFFVLKTDRIGGIDASSCKISKHNGAVYDIRWNPFNDNLIGSACDDGLVRLWNITDEKGVESNHSPVQTMKGHGKRVGGLMWHPSADNILASSSYDNTVKLWNAETAQIVSELSSFTNQITDMCFTTDGSQIGTTCKDKKLRVFDSHTGQIVVEGPGHDNMKVSRLRMLKDGNILTAGFSSMSSRCLRLYDPRNMSSKLEELPIDSATGSLFPHYDPDLNLMYIAGKGDANIKFYELAGGSVFYLNQYSSGDAQRGIGMMPKRGLDSTINEVARAYKLNVGKKLVNVIPLKVPRQSKTFAEDLYPDTAGYTPALTADQFIAGENSAPAVLPFLELQAANSTSKGFSASNATNGIDNSKEVATLKAEISALKNTVNEKMTTIETKTSRIEELEEENRKLEEQLSSANEEIAELQRNGVEDDN